VISLPNSLAFRDIFVGPVANVIDSFGGFLLFSLFPPATDVAV
jgi:hypothetical protein